MRKLIAIFAILMISAMGAYAVDFNTPVEAYASYTSTIIAPLQFVSSQAQYALPACIAGQTRDLENYYDQHGVGVPQIQFNLVGETGHAMHLIAKIQKVVTASGGGTAALVGIWRPSADQENTLVDISSGDFNAVSTDCLTPAADEASIIDFAPSSLTASPDARGSVIFPITVTAYYTSI